MKSKRATRGRVIIMTPRQRCRALLWCMRGYKPEAIARALLVPTEAVESFLNEVVMR